MAWAPAAVAQGASADMPCGGTTPEGWIASCTAMIEANTLHGRPLAAVYSQRGFAHTLKRNLAQAQTDLDEAIKIDPQYAKAFADRANFWTVVKKPELALADGEKAIQLDPNFALGYFVHGSAA